jgi:hypothetical protein
LGQIQEYIDRHSTKENSFVKTIQVPGFMEDDIVIVPRGFNVRFIWCVIKTLIARDSALQMLSCDVGTYQINECLASIDGGFIKDDLHATNSRINIKELPGDLSYKDTPWTEMVIEGSVHLTGCETFWKEVKWLSSKESLIENSRVEMIDCKLDLRSKVVFKGSEWHCLKGYLSTDDSVDLLELDPDYGKSPEQEAVDGGFGDYRPSTNNIRGTAGAGPGCIAHFKKLDRIKVDKGFKVVGSELNVYDVPKVTSSESPIISYKESNGTISKCEQFESPHTNIEILESGTVNAVDTNFHCTGGDPTIKVSGTGSTYSQLRKKVICDSDDTFRCDQGLIDLHEIEKAEAGKNNFTIQQGTVLLFDCKEFTAGQHNFENNKGTVESNNTQKLEAGSVIFKGENGKFILRGTDTQLKAGEKDVDGSGIFVAGAPTISFESLQDISRYIPGSS